MSPKVKFFIIFFTSITVFLIYSLFVIEERFYRSNVVIPYLEEPVQTELSMSEKISLFFVKKYYDYDIIITPKAHYRIYANVLNKHRYFFGIDSFLSPYDFVLGWGRYAREKNYSKVTFFQFRRWYYYFYSSAEFSDVGLYSANTHIIPSNNTILEGIKKIKKHDYVYMEGYLVNIDAVNPKGRQFTWNTSLSRSDSGEGACEIFYITKFISKYGIFE